MGLNSIKSLFVTSDEDNKSEQKTTVNTATANKFPSALSEDVKFKDAEKFNFVQSNKASEEHIRSFSEMYQSGFDSINQPGYDFYEFFQSVSSGGIDNPQIYGMAMSVAKAMNKEISKESLINSANFYLSEILKVHQNFVESGNGKKKALIAQGDSEKQSLTNELNELNKQLSSIRIQIQDRETKLSMIGDKIQPQISELDSKLIANDFTKDKIVTTIEKVKSGINNHIN